MSLVQIVIGLSLGAIFSVMASYQIRLSYKIVKDVDTKIKLVDLRTEIARTLVDQDLIERSLVANPGILACKEGTGPCPLGELPFDLVDTDGNIQHTNTGVEGYTLDGRPCDLSSTAPADRSCVLKVNYFFSVICEPLNCNGTLSMEVRGLIKQIPKPDINFDLKNPGRMTRLWAFRAPATVVEGRLSLAMNSIRFHLTDGTVKGYGYNRYGFINNVVAPYGWVNTPTALKDFSGSAINAKAITDKGASHDMLVKADGSLWTVGLNDTGDLGQGDPLAVLADFYPRIFIYNADGSSSRFAGVVPTARVPMAQVLPVEREHWRPVAGPLGDPTVADVKSIHGGPFGINMAIRENGDAYFFGQNYANRFGFPLLKNLPVLPLPPLTYVDPDGATQNHGVYWDDRFPDGTLPSSTEDFAAVYSAMTGTMRAGGPLAASAHPKYGGGGPIQAPGIVSTPKKSFYIGGPNFEIKDVTFGATYACAINQHDHAVCWGNDMFGALGRGDMLADIIADAGPAVPWTPGVAGPVKQTSRYGWGVALQSAAPPASPGDWAPLGPFFSPWNNPPNDLPDGLGGPASFHRVVDTAGNPLSDLVAIAGTGGHVCALKNDTTVHCWGRNDFGQLGRGFRCNGSGDLNPQSYTGACRLTDRAAPVIMASTGLPLTNVVKVVASSYRTFFVTNDGKLYAVGYQNPPAGYSLGVSGASVRFDRAVEISGITGNVVDMATTIPGRDQLNCAMNDSAELWCWGFNHDGDTTKSKYLLPGAPYYATPTLVPGADFSL